MKKRGDDSEDNGFAKWGGYMAAKKSKLQQQFSDDAKHEVRDGQIFTGVAIFVNGYTRPTAEELKQIMLQHGGTYHLYKSDATTHVIAANLPDSKVRQLKEQSKVVRPEWVTDSLAAGRLLDYRSYLLYPQQPHGQRQLGFLPTRHAKKPARLASDENFLSEFYSNSRLHHISTMGATFKQYVGQLRAASSGHFPGLDRLRAQQSSCASDLFEESEELPGASVIMHIDMDCFFVSVGLRAHPHLKGLPVAVTHGRGNSTSTSSRQEEFQCYKQRLEKKLGEAAAAVRMSKVDGMDDRSSMSEIASCSYEARRAGLKNGMFLGAALKLCPNLHTIPYDFDAYKEVSYILYDTVAEYTLDIEAVSCDEMFVDCTQLLNQAQVTPLEFATVLRQEIKEKTGCTASTGFGGNPLLARLATKRAKPDGQFSLTASQVEHFMQNIRVDDLPGVGSSVSSRLSVLGVETCGQLRELSLAKLQAQFGAKVGQTLYEHCRGEDRRSLHTTGQHLRKSVSAEVNYGIRFTGQAEADCFLQRLSGEVSARLAEVGLAGRCITLKLMVRAKDAPVETAKFLGHGVCDSINKSSTLAVPVADTSVIAREVLCLARQVAAPPGEWRGVGIQVSRLEQPHVCSSLDQFLSRSEAKGERRELDQPQSSTGNDISLSQVDPSFLEALPDDVRSEVVADLARSRQDKNLELSTEMPLQEIQLLVQEWVGSQQEPEQYDVYMLADYAERLVVGGSLDTLRVVLQLLRTCTSGKQSKTWQEAFENICDCAQEMMVQVCGKALDL